MIQFFDRLGKFFITSLLSEHDESRQSKLNQGTIYYMNKKPLSTTNLCQISLSMNGIGFMLTGLLTILSPATLARISEFGPPNKSAANELRANYGGMFFCYGLFLLYSALEPSLRQTAMIILTVTSFGVALGRLISTIMDGLPNLFLLVFWVLEITTVVINLPLLLKNEE